MPTDANAQIQLQAPGMTVGRWREATDAANVIKGIVLKTAVTIGERSYVQKEGWTSIAVAHGCIASVKPNSVEEVYDSAGKLLGVRAVGQVIRQADCQVLSEAEGFVGIDEVDWYGSHGEAVKRWSKIYHKEIEVVVKKRPDYAIRSMAQTRGISKACRNAFSHVIVLMNAGLSTTPAEEIANPEEQEEATRAEPQQKAAPTETKAPDQKKAVPEVPCEKIVDTEKQFEDGKWREVKIHFGTNKGVPLDKLEEKQIRWYAYKWEFRGNPTPDDLILRAALNVAVREANIEAPSS